MGEKAWLTVAEVASLLQLGQSTVYRLVIEKKLPGVRIGGSVRIPADKLARRLGSAKAA